MSIQVPGLKLTYSHGLCVCAEEMLKAIVYWLCSYPNTKKKKRNKERKGFTFFV